MEIINLWQLSDTKNALSGGSRGVDASLAKWDSIFDALNSIHSTIMEACGICYENESPKGSSSGCLSCPVGLIDLQCSLQGSKVQLTMLALRDAISRAGDVKMMLQKIKRDEEKAQLMKERREPVLGEQPFFTVGEFQFY